MFNVYGTRNTDNIEAVFELLYVGNVKSKASYKKPLSTTPRPASQFLAPKSPDLTIWHVTSFCRDM